MKKLVILALLIASPAFGAEKPDAKYGNALALANKCRDTTNDLFFGASCLEYLRGLRDGMNLAGIICFGSFPPDRPITNGQLKEIFLGYLARHAGKETDPDAVVAGLAFHEAFPCAATK